VDKEMVSFDQFSDIQVILDYRSLHNTLIDSYKWIGKISKENKDVSACLTNLEETVDKFWHHLENQYPDKLPSLGDVKEFNKHIKTLSDDERKEIADKIRTHMSQRAGEYIPDDFQKIFNYLIDKIP